MGRPVRFVILSVARSGSNMLCSMLDSHPEILCHQELFGGRHVGVRRARLGAPPAGTLAWRDRHPRAFLNWIWSQDLGCRAVGFKLLMHQSPRAHALVLADRSVKKIVLRRRNRLATYVSGLAAAQTGQYVLTRDEAGNGSLPQVHVDPPRFRRYVAKQHAYFEMIRGLLWASRQELLEVWYEELSGGAEQARLLAYIGVTARGELMEARTRRQSRGRVLDRIANADEVTAAFRGTRFEADLEA